MCGLIFFQGEGDNVEAGHYLERLWCPILSQHVPHMKSFHEARSPGIDDADSVVPSKVLVPLPFGAQHQVKGLVVQDVFLS
jgi:hypothetical protein